MHKQGRFSFAAADEHVGIHFPLDHGRPGFCFEPGIECVCLLGSTFTSDLGVPLVGAFLSKPHHRFSHCAKNVPLTFQERPWTLPNPL